MHAIDGHVRPPKQGRSQRSFERIVEATIGLLRERPYEQVRLAEICERSGVSTGSLYGRVGGKEDLLRAVQQVFLERLALQFDAHAVRIARETHGLAQTVPAVVTALGKLLGENAGVLRSFMQASAADAAIEELGKRSAQQNHARFTALLMRHAAQIRHPQPERAVASGMLLIYSAQARSLGLDSSTGELVASEWDALLQDLSDMMLAYLTFSPASQPTIFHPTNL
ncbi:TetR/AcrR family transcriptional regulator [Pseudoduganella umbonata]|uniref:AcrR family transcriptional regulator n=1 Tax=Pseudoduganella umbonata TaxID=864828 RepID=A0A4V1EED7_9BURK|nr:TetR/AcrR family transcriptional regulator [Pseudoduganella umbonata]MBB3221988.1 AcrR family transcriptional regulator [Pseudoduganella umbonata]QCP14221.1 TetR/AcrR family transcriptional regulator [Pseudoduganella umbonata]